MNLPLRASRAAFGREIDALRTQLVHGTRALAVMAGVEDLTGV